MRIILLLSLFLSTAALAGEGHPVTEEGDTRQVRSASSPKWLAAVGRQVVVTRTETTLKKLQCSLTLIADQIGKDGIIVVGAGHCGLAMYQVVTNPNPEAWHAGPGADRLGRSSDRCWSPCMEMVSSPEDSVTFWTNSGEKIVRKIDVVFAQSLPAGGNADYFIGRLDKAIPYSKIKPLLNAPWDYSDLLDKEMWYANDEPFAPFGTMAGYSADITIGEKGKVLTYDLCEAVNGGGSGRKKAYCWSYEGASGGPLAITLYLSKEMQEWMDDFTNYLPVGEHTFWAGNIFAGEGGDNHSRTLFTDSSFHTRILDPILEAH
ncbi:MAG: hypothetical protein QNK32_08330 [Porticoccus sp.]|nr:hypothetical protein [Porticoccus sp.]